jgi:hypothetical protein
VDDPEKRFTELYDEHHRRVLAYALAHVGRDTAEDVASETFLIAWRRLDDVPDTPLPWLLGVARNLLRRQRDGGNRRRALADRVAALTTPEDLAAWDVADRVIERDSALAAIASLCSGRSWYTDERTSSYVDQLLGRPQKTKTGHIRPPAVTKLPYGGFVSTGQETWIARDGSDRSRTITGIGFQTTFPTKEDEAKWKAAGSPDLLTPQKRSVNDYDIPLHFTIGGRQVTMAALWKLPTSAPGLEAELKRRWRADHAEADGFTLYVWGTAPDLLAGPITPGTKAALYRVLAGMPGIRNVGTTKDRLGRTGTALALPDSDGESRLIVDQRSGELLAHESWAKGARYPRLSEAYRSMGWAGGLSDRP